jgi:23S rRNA-/tRNA-specific pseudouridylate synthase
MNFIINNIKKHKIFTTILIFSFLIIITLSICLYKNYQKQEQAKSIDKYYQAMAEYKSTPSISNIKITNHTDHVENGYIYTDVTVTNNDSNAITYFEVTAKYLDSDKTTVLDKDYVNSSETLAPNESKKVEIMHKNDISYKYVNVSVSKIN